MKNSLNYKKYLIITIIAILIFMIATILLNILSYTIYNQNVNNTMAQIISNIKENYPEADINEIVQILNNPNVNGNDILKEYGIDLSRDSVVFSNSNVSTYFIIANIILICILMLVIILILASYNKKQNRKIAGITQYIKHINNGIYALEIQDNDEDELSILKNELYKITVMLREQAESSLNDKKQLKKSLEDISHQLKTPLTSITIMLDNLLDNPEMDKDTRNEFIKDIYREITNINFFIQTLLKLSKLDSNTINFNRKEESLENIINEAVKNVSMLCDLRNVDIRVSKKEDTKKEISEIHGGKAESTESDTNKFNIICDFKWQVEAITNILKNSVEHSNEHSSVNIIYDQNNMYSEIIIQDNGAGIDKADLKHIFERFYKGKNSGKDSIGIGLPLAKAIIEKDGGYVTVESELGKGTRFCVRYIV